MFSLPPNVPDIGDLQPLSDAIDALCEILEGGRAAFLELAKRLRLDTQNSQ